MAKYIVGSVVVLALSVAAFFGVARYQEAMNTPERVMAMIATDLTSEKRNETYERLSDRLKKRVSASDWDQLTAPLKGQGAPALERQEAVKDMLNTYPTGSNPQRFTHEYRINGKEYVTTTILYKQGNSWLIDEFQGDYR